ncbi:MAG TPA: hypothetical protein VFI84_00860 [Candidatus Saccharimonadales bacterium]|nr:hypothetical protein [Candidatus Saccharimonadales bacterium]
MHIRPYSTYEFHPSYGWDDAVFEDLEARAQDIADKFLGFCDSAPDVPYFTRYFHVEFPEQSQPLDDEELRARVKEIQNKWDLDEKETARLLKIKRVEQLEDSNVEQYEHSMRAVVLHGLFLEKLCSSIADKPSSKYYGPPHASSESSDWMTVLKSGNVVLKGRRNLHVDQASGQAQSIGFMYEAVREESLLANVAKLGKFVLGVALGSKAR